MMLSVCFNKNNKNEKLIMQKEHLPVVIMLNWLIAERIGKLLVYFFTKHIEPYIILCKNDNIGLLTPILNF